MRADNSFKLSALVECSLHFSRFQVGSLNEFIDLLRARVHNGAAVGEEQSRLRNDGCLARRCVNREQRRALDEGRRIQHIIFIEHDEGFINLFWRQQFRRQQFIDFVIAQETLLFAFGQ